MRHSAGLVALRKGSLNQFASSSQQALAILATHPLTILIDGLLLFQLAFPAALARQLPFRNVDANFELLRLLENRAAMITLVRD